jgi:hypothetical protein
MTVKYNLVTINGFDVPATFHDAIFKIKDGFQKGMISFYTGGFFVAYEPDKNKNVFSAVGYLLTRKQRQIIDELQEAGTPVIFTDKAIRTMFGDSNLEGMMSMTLDDAAEVQLMFEEIADNVPLDGMQRARQQFNDYLNTLLRKSNYENPALVYA